jgi:hypothetical protein
MSTPDTELLLRDASGKTAEALLSAEQYEWIAHRTEQHDMSPAQFIEHMLERLRRAEAIHERAKQSDTFKRVTDERTLLIPDRDPEEAADAESDANSMRFDDDDRSLFDFSPPTPSDC